MRTEPRKKEGMMRQMVSKSLNCYSIGILALVLACKTPPEVAEPLISEVEELVDAAEENIVESSAIESESTEVEAAETEDLSSSVVEEETSLSRYSEDLNNAIALLTSDDTVEEGLKQLQDIATNVLDVPQVFYNIGVAQLKLGEISAAEDSFLSAIAIDPTFSKAWVNRAVIYERRGDFNMAFDLYSQGLEHSGMDADLIAGQVACLRKMKRYEEAIQYAQNALKKNANNISAYNEIGTVYLEQQNYEKALFILQQAMNRNGGAENALIQSNLGKIYYAEDKTSLAKESFQKAIELDPNLIDAALLLSFIHLDNRAWATAEEVLLNAILLEPNNAAVLNSMGIAKRGLGEIDEAEKLYRQALIFEPNNPEPLLNLAILEADYRNKYEEAYALLNDYVNQGGVNKELVDQWRTEFEKSESAYLKEQKRQEFFERRRMAREESERENALEEERQAALEAEAEAETGETGDDGSENSEGVEDDTSEEAGDDSEESVDDSVDGSDDVEEGAAPSPEGENDDTSEENVDDSVDGSDDTEEAITPDPEVEDGTEDMADPEEEVQIDDSDASEGSWGGEVEDVPVEEMSDETAPVDDVPENEDIEEDGFDSEEPVAPTIDEVNPEEVETDENADVSWGGDSVTACDALDGCDDSNMQCSQVATCLPKGQIGTDGIGESCLDTSECAYGLECLEEICMDGGE